MALYFEPSSYWVGHDGFSVHSYQSITHKSTPQTLGNIALSLYRIQALHWRTAFWRKWCICWCRAKTVYNTALTILLRQRKGRATNFRVSTDVRCKSNRVCDLLAFVGKLCHGAKATKYKEHFLTLVKFAHTFVPVVEDLLIRLPSSWRWHNSECRPTAALGTGRSIHTCSVRVDSPRYMSIGVANE